MIKNYRITGLVSYRVDRGIRLAIPTGELVEIDERQFEEDGNLYAARMTWIDSAGKKWSEKWTPDFWVQLVRTQMKEA